MLRRYDGNENILGLSQRHADKWEGGYTNDKNDSGGVTNYGVSLRYLKDKGSEGDLNGDGVVNASDVRSVTRQKQNELFQKDFWDKLHLDEVPPRVAFCLYDIGVNCGAGTAAKFLQRAVGEKQDGIIGPKTIAAARKHNSPELDEKLALKLCDLSGKRYDALAEKYPKNKKFLNGWRNRNNDRRAFVTQYAWNAE